MNKFLTTVCVAAMVVMFNTPSYAVTNDIDHIYLNFTRKEVCSNRARKCWPVAFGDKYYPTPQVEGPVFVLTHFKNGFTWRNPFTGAVYKPGTHNLGNIWIQYTTRNGIDIGLTNFML